jgi:hypothetical protein
MNYVFFYRGILENTPPPPTSRISVDLISRKLTKRKEINVKENGRKEKLKIKRSNVDKEKTCSIY